MKGGDGVEAGPNGPITWLGQFRLKEQPLSGRPARKGLSLGKQREQER